MGNLFLSSSLIYEQCRRPRL